MLLQGLALAEGLEQRARHEGLRQHLGEGDPEGVFDGARVREVDPVLVEDPGVVGPVDVVLADEPVLDELVVELGAREDRHAEEVEVEGMREARDHLEERRLVALGADRVVEDQLEVGLDAEPVVELGDVFDGLVLDAAVVEVARDPLARLDAHVDASEAGVAQHRHALFVDELGLDEDLEGEAHLLGVQRDELLQPVELEVED
ncbi:MAG: hypothetical protein ACK559_15990, partial [bacterium]